MYVRTGEREWEGEDERTPAVSSYDLSTSITRSREEEERKRERGRRRERTKGRNSESERGTQHTRTHIHRRPRNCLRFCFTSRGYLSIAFIDFSHSCFLRCSARPGSPPISPPSRKGRERSCARKNAKWPEIFVCASLCNYSLWLL